MNTDVEELEVIIKKIKYKGVVWVPESKNKPVPVIPPGKQNYFYKWVMDKPVGSVFGLKDFYKLFPKHEKDSKCQSRIETVIADLFDDGFIMQWRKDMFKRCDGIIVNKDV